MTDRRPPESAMRSAFLDALVGRVARDPAGSITLPTGAAAARDVAQVLGALDRARQAEGRRC